MQLHQQLGYLAFGSRLRRLSESFLTEINAVYKNLQIPFDASWFSIFYLLEQHHDLSIKEIAAKSGVSHSASSQLVSVLQQKGLLQSVVAKDDARKRTLTFTTEGLALLQQVKPVWGALEKTMEVITAKEQGLQHLLNTVKDFERVLEEQPFAERIMNAYEANATSKLS